MQDIPLREGDAAWPLVAGGRAAAAEFADRPAFIGWGLRDFVFDKHFLDGFRDALPQAQVHAFEDAGHYVLEDKHAELVPAIRAFLDATLCSELPASGVTSRRTLDRMTDACNIAAALPRLARERPTRSPCAVPVARRDGFARYDVALTYAELDARSDAIAAGLAQARHRPRHAHGDDGAAVAGVLPADVRAVQGRRGAGAGRSGHRPPRVEAVPGRSAAGSLHRHSARACRARCCWAGHAARTKLRHRRLARSAGADATLAEVERAGRRRRRAARRHPARRRRRASCSPAAPPACPRAWSTAIAISSRRSNCCAMRSASQPGGVDLPTFPPFASVRSRAGTDLDHSRHGSDPARQRRSAQAAACDPHAIGVTQLFGSPALMRVLARPRRDACRRAARHFRRRAGAAGSGGRRSARCCPTTRSSGRLTAPPNACRSR